MNFGQLRTTVANELGVDANAAGTGTEQTTVDDALNAAVVRVLTDTHCYIKATDFSSFDGTSTDYTLDPTILEIVELYLSSGGTQYALERVSIQELFEMRRVGAPTGNPSQFYAVAGDNLVMFYPAPASTATLRVYHVPIPTAMSASANDPSTTTYGGVPTPLHKAVKLAAQEEVASYDDDQTSAQGQRYADLYDKEITRQKLRIRKKGGDRNARAVVNDKHRRRFVWGRQDVY